MRKYQQSLLILTVIGTVLLFCTPDMAQQAELPETEWLDFSDTDFAPEREIVREYWKKSILDAEAFTRQPVEIAVALYDLNGDEEPEIIWVLVNRVFRGYNKLGHLGAFTWRNGEVKHIPLPQVQTLKVGVRPNAATGWKDFLIDGKLYSWNGKGYSLDKSEQQ